MAYAFSNPALTIGVHPWGDKVGSWMENTLEKSHSSPAPRAEVAILSVRATKEAGEAFESGYAVSMKGPSERSALRVSVLNKGKTVWTRKNTHGKVALVDEWPRFASAGAGRNGYPTVGWAYSSTKRIHLPTGSHAKMDTTVMGDQIRVVLEAKPQGHHSGILRLHCSPEVDSMRVQSIRAGLFNLAHKK